MYIILENEVMTNICILIISCIIAFLLKFLDKKLK